MRISSSFSVVHFLIILFNCLSPCQLFKSVSLSFFFNSLSHYHPFLLLISSSSLSITHLIIKLSTPSFLETSEDRVTASENFLNDATPFKFPAVWLSAFPAFSSRHNNQRKTIIFSVIWRIKRWVWRDSENYVYLFFCLLLCRE